ncbi:MAG: hypothetical protein ABFD98_06990 [Syntrophobacteraceae bacterium]|nr:hypothetical protein [Desulfobacteraceae bacterium]
MKWIEIITLRSIEKANRVIVDELLDQFFKQRGPGLPSFVSVYNHSLVETDLSIHMHWETQAEPPGESLLSQRLSYALRDLGMLNHSVWIESETIA